MISKRMESALNEQINKEMFSAFLYMSMSADCADKGLKGSSVWFMTQYHEEMVHAMKIYEYIQKQGAKVRLVALEEPQQEFASLSDMFDKTLEHEKLVTSSINDLMNLAVEERDHATQAFLNWYVTEQVEEEDTAMDIIQRIKLIGDNSSGLYMLDKELGARTVSVPTDFSTGVESAMGGE
ncbi:ferritin [Chitinispirillales bacterium ANBcel5]|uniref:ferritin n=1 Tax=Cellulosispirillum alkaliphilum TaxID=3039283 RepID=UPI002A50BC1D|nr:ferritin [Chitinispirillales bacterium ANBcel5]